MPFTTGLKKREDIQILRAIAVLAVIVFHLDESRLLGGFLGVDVFFVISGFLITGIITRALSEGRFSLSNFYLRRIKRLFPALALVLLFTVLFAVICLPPLPFDGLMEHLPWASLQIANFSFMRGVDYFGASSAINPVLHTWSLGVEEQFYLTWAPLLIAFYWLSGKRFPLKGPFRPVGLMIAVIVIGIAAEFFTLATFGESVSFFSPFSRMWELALGGLASACLGTVYASRLRESRMSGFLGLIGFLIIAISLHQLSETASANPFLRAIPCMGAFLVLMFPTRISDKPLWAAKRIGVYIGDISYSLYLWHWPVICFAPYLTDLQESPQLLIISIVLMAVCAVASYHFCEKPFMKDLKWNRFLSLRSSTAIAALMLIGGAGYALRSEEKADWRFDIGEISQAEAAWVVPQLYEALQSANGEDYLFSTIKESEVILLGDSHARHFAPVVDAWAKGCFKSKLFTCWGGRFFAIGTEVGQLEETGRGGVQPIGTSETSRLILESITGSDVVKVVFVALRSAHYAHPLLLQDEGKFAERFLVDLNDPESEKTNQELYEYQVNEFVGKLVTSGKNVVLLGQATPLPWLPKPGDSLWDRALNRDLKTDGTPLPQDLASRLDIEDRVYRKAAEHPQIYYLPTREIITKAFSKEGAYLYYDYNHLRYQGAMEVLEPLTNLFKPLEG